MKNIVFSFLLFFSGAVIGQEFIFGLYTNAVFSQIEGDNLKGFDKLGYSIGIEGGFEFNQSSSIIIRQGLSKIGSTNTSIDLVGLSKWFARFDLSTFNFMVAYRYGSGYKRRVSKNNKYFYLGLKSHFMLKHDVDIVDRNSNEIFVTENQVRKYFLAVQVGFDYKVYKGLYSSINIESAVSNIIINNPNFLMTLPYYVSFGFHYGF